MIAIILIALGFCVGAVCYEFPAASWAFIMFAITLYAGFRLIEKAR